MSSTPIRERTATLGDDADHLRRVLAARTEFYELALAQVKGERDDARRYADKWKVVAQDLARRLRACERGNNNATQ